MTFTAFLTALCTDYRAKCTFFVDILAQFVRILMLYRKLNIEFVLKQYKCKILTGHFWGEQLV
jgi:hypothetical protein